MISADEIIRILGMKPLPEEGGYYVETYRADERLLRTCLPKRYTAEKKFATAIYYLLTPDTFSAMHKLITDEIFHFYLGDPVTMLQLYPDGSGNVFTLGPDILNAQVPQLVVPKGTWQGLFLNGKGTFALLGTTVAPGFDFSDYESSNREQLIEKYPEHKNMITRLTRKEDISV